MGAELSHETVSKIVDEIGEEALAWQRRPLKPFCPMACLDAIVVEVRDGAHVRNKSAHIAIGVDLDGVRHVLGI
jgi:transposase-like protein